MSSALSEKARSLFVRRWGEMAASWGVSRTMAEIHALMFISSVPLCTDDVMEQLQVSRGNASMNLRQLVAWGLIQRVHRRGDRKEYFVAESDVWQMFEIITRERRRREIEPIVETLDKCCEMLDDELKQAQGDARTEAQEFRQRLERMQEFFTLMNRLFNLVIKADRAHVAQMVKLLS